MERKAAINEKEQATSENVEDQPEPVSAGALEGNQDQCKPEAKTEWLQMGTKGKDEDKDLTPDSDSASSILFNADDMILSNEGGGYKGLDLNAEQKDLYNFYKGE